VTRAEFEQHFRPERDDHDGYVWRDWGNRRDQGVLLRAAEDGRVWTLMNAEGERMLVSGMHPLFAVGPTPYLTCAVPVVFGQEVSVPWT
jgi:hypothetical protein